MRIINIIDRFDKVNYGIWNAAIATAPILKEKFNVVSELWYPSSSYNVKLDIDCVPLNRDIDSPEKLIQQRNLKPESDIIVTHGCWQYPTRWGYAFKKLGFKWVYTPHGMLEPWSMKQKWLQKKVYYYLIERKYTKLSDIVRAVGKPELLNLKKIFRNTILIPNGSNVVPLVARNKKTEPLIFLFMARLHHKKGIIPLIHTWKSSKLSNNSKYKLIIAGPDDGELNNLKKEIQNAENVKYIGAIYDDEKINVLKSAHFFVLPSFSEGFPTSVIEAMQYSLIPIITEGCNFPEAFEHKLAIKISPEIKSIKKGIESVINYSSKQLESHSEKCFDFASQNYSLEKIAKQQYNMYITLIPEGNNF